MYLVPTCIFVGLSADISNSWTLPDELEERSEKKVLIHDVSYKPGNLAKVNYHELFFWFLMRLLIV